MGLSATLATASRSLELFSAGVQVAGQNISNASTPGYVREALILETGGTVARGSLLFGLGANATGIQQQIDKVLEGRLYAANGDAASSVIRATIFQELETQLSELGDADLSTRVNEFLASINDVVNQPESTAIRQLAVQQGQQLATDIGELRSRVDSLLQSQDGQIDSLLKEANSLIDQIRQLNPQIVRLEAGGLSGSTAGGLRSERYTALSRLSEILPITYRESSNGSVEIFSGSDYLVLGSAYQHLETTLPQETSSGGLTVRLTETKTELTGSGGELGGRITGRDAILGGFIEQLDTYAGSLIFEFNRIHSVGEGTAGYTSVTAEANITNTTAPLNAAGLAFTPQHGSFDLKVMNTTTGLTETTTIAVDLDGLGTETSLDSLRAALDAVGNVSATINSQGRLQIQTASGYEVRFSGDTSNVLAALGINTFFTGSDSATISVNATVAKNPAYFATSQGGGPSDGRNAASLAAFLDQPVAALGGASLNNYYDGLVASLGQSSSSEAAVAKGFAGFRDSLLSQREQFSGVSLDEEAIRMMEFQQAYQAAARIVSTVDELFTTILNL